MESVEQKIQFYVIVGVRMLMNGYECLYMYTGR